MSDLDVQTEAQEAEQKAALEAAREKAEGPVVGVDTSAGFCIFRRAKRAEYARYMTLLMEKETRAKAADVLTAICIVNPTRDVFSTWCDEYPGIVTTCVNEVLKLSGFDPEATAKKA